jgi:hypothetical protein
MPPEARQRLQRRPAMPPAAGTPPMGGGPPMGKAPAPAPRVPPAAPQGKPPEADQQRRAAMNSAMAKASAQLGVPAEALQGFSLEELQLLPKAMEKLSEILSNTAQDEAEQKMFGMEAGAALRQSGRGASISGNRSKQQIKDDLQQQIPLKSPKR